MGSGKGGGGGHTPIEQPNTLESAQRLKIIDLLCEGVAGQDVSFKNIYLDNTPIQNSDGSYNFTGIRVSALAGTHNQDYLAGFDTTDKIVSVGVQIKASKPITRTITDPLVDSVRVTLALGSLVTMKDNGDRVGGSVSLTVNCGNKTYPVTISGKTTSAYHQDVVLTDLPDAPFNISVHRNTPDSTSDSTSNATHWVSYVESIDAKFNYPNSVVVGLEIDSAQFGGKVPKRTYLNQWTQIKVPNNYDPINRTYEGVWLGEFKIAWSNNPAWVFYDLVTDKRYGLGDRLGDFGCDKWSLYQIAKYCDQMVPDGFGGEEPRFTCNAYLSEPRDAKALLDDLASVFRGIAVWDGQMVMALQDAKKDPVATYSNSNVVDGLFSYSGAAQKTIFTAVHVKYNDKADSYTTKTEYVANDEAIKRYGLNIKQTTAFGCTSRGQAARVGKWLIETSIRERQMVSFKVGREGIRHLPFDIIEIADNDYAGDMIAGRVLSVNGNTITADRAMSDINSIRYYASGQSRTVSVEAINDTTITLAEAPAGIEQLGVFSAIKTDVKPRLFRALSIKEDDGTYTISAVQHDENKEAVVDQGVTFEQDSRATKHTPKLSYGRVSKDGDALLLAWEGTNTTKYLIKIYKDGKLYKSYTQPNPEIKLKGLPNGDYRAEIRGKSASGQLTEAVIKTWSIDYNITGLKATPELFAIALDWTNPTTVINKAKIEIYRSQTADRATATKVATLPYPTDTFTQNGVKLTETLYFWLRLVDEQGNTGNWVTISGQCSSDTSQIVESITGKITQTELAQSLIDSLQSDIDTAKNQAIGSAATDAAKKVAAEAKARQQALDAQDKKQTDSLIAKADELGTQIAEVSGTTGEQAQQITTLTAKQGELVSGLEIERTARIAGDTAEAEARQTLVSQINGNKTSITDLQSTKASKTEVSSLARTALQSEWQASANAAKTQAINAAKADATAKANAAKSDAINTSRASIDQISQTVSNNQQAAANQLQTLSSKIDDIEIGGRNLLIGTGSPNNYVRGTVRTSTSVGADWFRIDVVTAGNSGIINATKSTHTLKSGDAAVLSFEYRTDYTNLNYTYIMNDNGNWAISPRLLTVVKDQWQRAVMPFVAPKDMSNVRAMVGGISSAVGSYLEVRNFKLERGTIATDWTPAPEDITDDINQVSSEFTSFKQTQASKDQAQTLVNNQALSRISNAEGKISTLESTKASKTEVSSLARTALQSEWRDYADNKVDSLEIGGRNLLVLANDMLRNCQLSVYIRNYNKILLTSQTSSWLQIYPRGLPNGIYTCSFKIKKISGDIKNIGGHTYPHQSIKGTIDGSSYFAGDVWSRNNNTYPADTNTHVISVVLQIVDDSSPVYIQINRGNYNFAVAAIIWDVQLEKGNKATDWTPAPEDVAQEINKVSADLVTLSHTSVTKAKAQSTHTIKTQAIAGGKRALAGIAVGAMANETTAESQVIVMADKFGVVKNASDGVVKPMLTVVNNQVAVNGDLIADGTILGKHIKANQTLSAPIINGGSLNINNRFKVDKFGNLTGKSGRFEGTVLADEIEGDVANIATASVGTLQIANDAVIVPRTQFSEVNTDLTSSTLEYELSKMTIDAKGGSVILMIDFDIYARVLARAEGSSGYITWKCIVSVFANDELLRTYLYTLYDLKIESYLSNRSAIVICNKDYVMPAVIHRQIIQTTYKLVVSFEDMQNATLQNFTVKRFSVCAIGAKR